MNLFFHPVVCCCHVNFVFKVAYWMVPCKKLCANSSTRAKYRATL